MTFRVGGDYFTPAAGRYVGQFNGTADGPKQTYKQDDGSTKTGNTIKWFFHLYNLDGTPVIDTKTGGLAVAEGLSSDTVGMGRGTPAKARVWLTKLLESKGSQWVDPQTADDVTNMVEFCKGTFVYLTFTPRAKGGTQLNEIERMAQPGAAPVAPAIPAATVFAAPPVAPVQAPVAAATLPVPAATPFAPTALPTQETASIPSMPFPVAQ